MLSYNYIHIFIRSWDRWYFLYYGQMSLTQDKYIVTLTLELLKERRNVLFIFKFCILIFKIKCYQITVCYIFIRLLELQHFSVSFEINLTQDNFSFTLLFLRQMKGTCFNSITFWFIFYLYFYHLACQFLMCFRFDLDLIGFFHILLSFFSSQQIWGFMLKNVIHLQVNQDKKKWVKEK